MNLDIQWLRKKTYGSIQVINICQCSQTVSIHLKLTKYRYNDVLIFFSHRQSHRQPHRQSHRQSHKQPHSQLHTLYITVIHHIHTFSVSWHQHPPWNLSICPICAVNRSRYRGYRLRNIEYAKKSLGLFFRGGNARYMIIFSQPVAYPQKGNIQTRINLWAK